MGILTALESQIAETNQEIEYTYFVKVTSEQLRHVLESNKIEITEKQHFSELKLCHHDGNTARLRKYVDGDNVKCELTTKKATDSKLEKIEDNYEITEDTFKILSSIATNKVVRARICIPVKSGDEVVKRKNGEPLLWEVDIYIDGRMPVMDTNTLHPWIKVDMEVDKATLDDVSRFIPFEYEEIIDNATATVEERAFISLLYDEYNLIK